MQTQQQRYRGLTNAHKRDFLDIFFCLLPALSLYRTVVACPGPPEWSFGKYSNSFPWRVTSPRPKSCLTDKHRWFVAFKWTVLLYGCSLLCNWGTSSYVRPSWTEAPSRWVQCAESYLWTLVSPHQREPIWAVYFWWWCGHDESDKRALDLDEIREE